MGVVHKNGSGVPVSSKGKAFLNCAALLGVVGTFLGIFAGLGGAVLISASVMVALLCGMLSFAFSISDL